MMIENEDKWLGKSGRQREIYPELEPSDQKKLINKLQLRLRRPEEDHIEFAANLREQAQKWRASGAHRLTAVANIISDLCENGWDIESAESGRVVMNPPGRGFREDGVDDISQVKERIQKSLLVRRDRQLQEASVQKFIARMNRPFKRAQGKFSINDIIDNGNELADLFEKNRMLPANTQERELTKIIKPEIEVCTDDRRCASTGLKLMDIWRYCRHTWSLEYRSIPGRHMPILIRNAARPNRPIMGIAMIASPVVRLGQRDNWIGWTIDSVMKKYARGQINVEDFATALLERLELSIAEVRYDDLVEADGSLEPTDQGLLRLLTTIHRAERQRENELADHRASQDGNTVSARRDDAKPIEDEVGLLRASETPLFIAKRARVLHGLLETKKTFLEHGLATDPQTAMRYLFTSKNGRAAIEKVLAEFTKAGIASNVMDVSVCGAVAPYNELICGKLVAMLLASRELQSLYDTQYGDRQSIIASRMAGRPIVRDTTLNVLTTTSLYGVGTSQYNRLKLRAADHHGLGYDISWEKLGDWSAGFGTVHLSKDTVETLRQVAIDRAGLRRVNNVFGEGASPRLRTIREGLDALGIDSDHILHHATPRIVFGCELFPGARDQLLKLPVKNQKKKPSVDAIARAWRRRWLLNRCKRDETIAKLRTLGPKTLQEALQFEPVTEQMSLKFG